MARSARLGALALVVFLLASPPAHAFGWRASSGQTRPSATYSGGYGGCLGAPVHGGPVANPVFGAAGGYATGVCVPAPFHPGTQVRPVPRDFELAIPKPAPPSSKEPPLGSPPKRAPLITESRSQGGHYAQGQKAGERVLVGFWNFSGREVTLEVDGQSRVVARDKGVNLEVGRNFVWQIDQAEPKTERVPEDQRRFEVLIR